MIEVIKKPKKWTKNGKRKKRRKK